MSPERRTFLAFSLLALASLAPRLRGGEDCWGPEDFESGQAPNWELQEPWAVSEETAASGTHSLSDSPGTFYDNNANTSATIDMDLGACGRPMLTFEHLYTFERCADFGFVEVSTDRSNWAKVLPVTGFGGAAFLREEVDLSGWAGRLLTVRFRVRSDAQNRFDGWSIDDVAVTDNTASLPYPFFDTMDSEASEANWIPSAWRRVPGGPSGAGFSWSYAGCQRPGADSNNAVPMLVLEGTLNLGNLAEVTNPQLSLWHRKSSGPLNTEELLVYLSSNCGRTWDGPIRLERPQNWSLRQIDLTGYRGSTCFLVAFQAYHYYAGTWEVDDVCIDNAARDVTVTARGGSDSRHCVLLQWTPSADPSFLRYEVYRASSPNVVPQGAPLATISDVNTTSFEDCGLEFCDTPYYYRVVVVTQSELCGREIHNWGAGDVPYRTDRGDLAPFPFADDMEAGDRHWCGDFPWELVECSPEDYCWQDSPDTFYENSTSRSLTFDIDLPPASRPMLTFEHLYTFERCADFGFVEVSADRSNWMKALPVTGLGGEAFLREEVDLSGWAGRLLTVRFRLRSDAQNRFDGWSVDDVAVTDNTASLPYPFCDTVDTEASEANWIPSAWRRVPGGPSGAGFSWSYAGCQRPGADSNNAAPMLVLEGKLNLGNLAEVTNPQLSFWHRKSSGPLNTEELLVFLSSNCGRTWAGPIRLERPQDWSLRQIDLTGYRGSTCFLVAFQANHYYAGTWEVDDLRICEAPEDPACCPSLPCPPPGSFTVEPRPPDGALLTWVDRGSDETGFRVERRVGDGPWEVVAELPPDTTSYLDGGLPSGERICYRVACSNSGGDSLTDVICITTGPSPAFSLEPGPEPNSLSLVLETSEKVRGGTVCLGVDPSVAVLSSAVPGAAIPEDAEILITRRVFDSQGVEVPGGYLLGWLNSLEGDVTVGPGAALEVLVLRFSAAVAGGCTPVTFEGPFKSGPEEWRPLQWNSVVDDEGNTLLSAASDGEICVVPLARFVRGDPNEDGRLALSDAVTTLGFLYRSTPSSLSCEDAADADDDGRLRLTDAVFWLGCLFRGTACPPAPFGAVPFGEEDCGLDPTEDGLDCEEFEPCAPAS